MRPGLIGVPGVQFTGLAKPADVAKIRNLVAENFGEGEASRINPRLTFTNDYVGNRSGLGADWQIMRDVFSTLSKVAQYVKQQGQARTEQRIFHLTTYDSTEVRDTTLARNREFVDTEAVANAPVADLANKVEDAKGPLALRWALPLYRAIAANADKDRDFVPVGERQMLTRFTLPGA